MLTRKINKLLLILVSAVMFVSAINPTVLYAALDTSTNRYRSMNNIPFTGGGNDLCISGNMGDSSNLIGGDNLEKIFNYFLGKGLSPIQAAGVVGNIAHESGGIPTRVQGSGMITNDDPSAAGGGGWGIIQWTPGSKITGIAERAGVTGDITELSTQLDIVWWHMTVETPTGVKNFIDEYKAIDIVPSNSLSDEARTRELREAINRATLLFMNKVEAPGAPMSSERNESAFLAYEKWGNNGTTLVTTPSSSGSGGGIDVVLDPGHSGINKQGQEIDPATTLYIGDSNNHPEREVMMDVANKIKGILEPKGYSVKMTKNSADDYVNLADRARIANDANAQIAVSLHYTPGSFGSESTGWVTPQEVGQYRTGTNGTSTTFEDGSVASKSIEYADKILTARKEQEGGVQKHTITFDGREGLSGGNISIVQLLSKVPWVYNEAGQDGFNADKYAMGIANGIILSINPGGGGGDECRNSGAQQGNVIQTAVNYAWETAHPGPYLNMKPSYKEAVDKAKANGKFVGGGIYPGIDCGGFVTRVMQDSGADPEYGGGGNTILQKKHMDESGKYTKITGSSGDGSLTSADLMPGDIAINSVHTYLYVGKVDGFDSVIASASWGSDIPGSSYWLAPMAGLEIAADPNYSWYRLDKGTSYGPQ